MPASPFRFPSAMLQWLLGLIGLLSLGVAHAGLLAEYRFDETAWTGAAGEVLDSSGNGRHGTRLGLAQTSATAYACRAMDVPGNSSTAASGVTTGIDVDSGIGASGAILFWYRLDNSWNSSAPGTLLDASSNSTGNPGFFLARLGGGYLRFSLSDSGGARVVVDSADQSFPAKTWVHIGVTWKLLPGTNASVVRLYVNGALAGSATTTTTGALHAALGALVLGDNSPGVTPFGGTVNSANGVLDELQVIQGDVAAAEVGNAMNATRTCGASTLNRLQISHATGSGLTCTPSSVTITACQDAACSVAYTGGVSGSLTASGAGMSTQFPDGAAFSIPAGSSSTTVRLQLTTAGSVLLGTSGVSPSAAAATTCTFGSPSCTFSAAAAGLLFDVPNHVSDTVQSVAVSAVRASDNAKACVPAFAGVTRTVNLRCAYASPASGTLPVRVNGSALNAAGSSGAACDAGGRNLGLAFDATGTATLSVQYADVGQMSMTATYSGSGSDAGLTMSGSDGFVATPASFAFGALPTLAQAGVAFAPTVTARNASGATTPNFGRESPAQAPTLALTNRQPAANGVLGSPVLGAFSGGTASWTGVSWSEVGTLDLSATLSAYLGATASASGSATVRFVPFRLAVALANRAAACSAAGYAYSGEPMAVTVTAQNAAFATTVNYQGSHAKAVALALVPPAGADTFSAGGGIVASAFTAGVGQVSAPVYTFADKQSAPRAITLRATDADAVVSVAASEGALTIRSGRLRLSNAYGSERSPLVMPLVAEVWSGQAWVPHAADHFCTALSSASVARSNARTASGATGSWSTTATVAAAGGGRFTLTLAAPNTAGTLDVALNLGATAADQACLGTHPASTGAAVPWLRSRNGSCGGWDRDPSARAAFGIYSPESQRTVHVRDVF